MKGNAFIGVSLDTKIVSRAWLRYAIKYVIQKHHSLLFLIADDLLRYTRTTRTICDKTILDIGDTSEHINRRRIEFEKFINSELKHLDGKTQERIYVKTWGSFADHQYVQILRNLQIAYSTIIPFQQSVNDVAMEHINKTFTKLHFPNSLQACAGFLIDEVAMCLRITEIEDYSYEYYPARQIDILTQLYANRFTSYGISVENLTGKKKRTRKFHILIIDQTN